METLPGALAIGHVRYSTAGSKGDTADPRRAAVLWRVFHGRCGDRA